MRCRLALLLIASWGCNDGGQLSEYPVDMGDMGDMGDVGTPDCGFEDPACNPPNPCDWTDSIDTLAQCVDLDGDCRPGSCPVQIPAPLQDCNDRNAAIHAGAPELCNARDDDCDGKVDEDLDLAEICQGCGGMGRLECHASDPHRVACSTDPGQSAAPPNLPDERCDGIDNDCDEVIDEACALADVSDATAVRRCGSGAILLDAEALRRLEPRAAPAVVARGTIVAPACTVDAVVWLALDPASTCGPQPEGPWACTAARLVSTRALVEPIEGTLGAPQIIDGYVYLHRIVDGQIEGLRVNDRVLDRFADLSDPTPFGVGLAGRLWTEDSPRLVRQLAGQSTVIAGGEQPGVPRGGSALAWTTQASTPQLWIAVDGAPGSVQVGTALPDRLWMTPDAVYWLDAQGLQRFDLRFGTQQAVRTGAFDALDVGPDGMAWIEAGVLRLSAIP